MSDSVKTLNLATLVSLQHARFQAIAQVWIAWGAKSFSVQDTENNNLFVWPKGVRLGRQAIITQVPGGSMRVEIAAGSAIEQRLGMDAELISQLFELESDIDIMAADLIDAQDQILALYQLTESLRRQLDMNETTQTMAREAARLLKVESACVVLFNRDDTRTVVYSPGPVMDEDALSKLFDDIRENGQEILVNEPDNRAGAKNMFLFPIKIRDEVQGVVGYFNRSGGFRSPHLKMARAITEEAGAHVEKNLLYQEMLHEQRLRTEFDMAADIQARLLPQETPQIPGLDIAGASIQARQVGGDFYDFIPTSDGDLVFLVGDVAGKGLSSALLMAMTRSVLRSHTRNEPNPGKILENTNLDMYDDYTEVAKFTTVFMGWFHDNTIHFANAGHSPVIYCPNNDDAHLLAAEDMPLGILSSVGFVTQNITFNTDDILVIATDGFSEATDESGTMFGYDRLTDLVKSLADRSAQAICDTLFEIISNYGKGQIQQDDQTLVVVKCKETKHDNQ